MVFAVVFVKVKVRADGVLQFMIYNHTRALQKGREVKGGERGRRERGRWREREEGRVVEEEGEKRGS